MGQFLSGPCTLVEIEESYGDNLKVGVGSMQVFSFKLFQLQYSCNYDSLFNIINLLGMAC